MPLKASLIVRRRNRLATAGLQRLAPTHRYQRFLCSLLTVLKILYCWRPRLHGLAHFLAASLGYAFSFIIDIFIKLWLFHTFATLLCFISTYTLCLGLEFEIAESFISMEQMALPHTQEFIVPAHYIFRHMTTQNANCHAFLLPTRSTTTLGLKIRKLSRHTFLRQSY